jgi:hypothetical protein
LTTQSAANRRFLVVAAAGFALFFAIDAYLFAFSGFLRTFGQRTQEGQVLSKVARARTQAAIADVIFFGSSYIRSGVAGDPFLASGVLPFNFAVSGGGPLYDYFALKRIAPVLARRAEKPTLVLELKIDALRRTRNSAWSEFPQYSAIVRSRGEALRESPRLWRNFRDFAMSSQFVSSVVVPSSIYRAEAVPMLGERQSREGFFYGTEDFSGFSPLYTIARPSMVPDVGQQPPLRIDELYPGKVEFLRHFLALARTTGCPVVLFQSPSIMLGRDGVMLDPLIARLVAEFPGARVVRASDVVLTVDDFDEGGHLNIKGSDEAARRLIAALGLAGDARSLETKIDAGFLRAAVPEPSAWTLNAARAATAGRRLTIAPAASADPVIARSPEIALSPEGEWILEVAMPIVRGRLSLGVSWAGADGRTHEEQFVTPPEGERFGASLRAFIRMPGGVRATISILDYNVLVAQPPSEGHVEVLRLWRNR